MKQTTVLLFLLVLVGIARADSLDVRLIGSCLTYDMAFDVAVSGDYAYVADFNAGLTVISVADPAHASRVGRCDSLGSALGVVVSGDYAYVAAINSGLWVVSVADPAHPTAVGRYDSPGKAMGVAVAGTVAYVADGDSGLRVVSIADPEHPSEVSHCSTQGEATDVVVVGDYAYVGAADSGLRVISVVDPSHPVEVGHCSVIGGALDVAVDADNAYIAAGVGGMAVVSIADPAHPVEVGRGQSVWPHGVAARASLAYVGADEGAMKVFTAADPTHPVEVGRYDLPATAMDVVVAGRYHYAYVADMQRGMYILQFYGGALGDLDVDNDSLDVVADTVRLLSYREPGSYGDFVLGEFILANTSESYNPDAADGPSTSPVDSLSFTGSLAGPGGTLDSVLVLNLPGSLAQGQAIVCTLAAYAPESLAEGEYSGSIVIAGFDTLHHLTAETVYARVARLGDIDVDNDSLDVVADTISVWPRRISAGPPPEFTEYAIGGFILANTSESYNPDTADGPSLTRVDSFEFAGSLSGPGGTLDSVLILGLPGSLNQGQTAKCTLAVYMPPFLPDGDYVGTIAITGKDSVDMVTRDVFQARIVKQTLADLDVDNESLSVASDTMQLHTQSAGPVYSPYAKARFMLVNTYKFYNPDIEDGPGNSPFYITGYSAYLSSPQDTVDSIYVPNLPESLAAGQTVECTLALAVPVGTSLDDYFGLVTIDAYDTAGYRVRDSFFLVVRGPQPRRNLDSLRVAPIPFKPNHNPEHDAIHFQGLSAGARVIVYDASGQSVWSATENGDGHLAWKAEVASGIYMYLVTSADGKASKVGKLSVIR